MDPAPREFADLPRDPELGVPLPFACGTADRYGARPDGRPPSARTLDRRRVTQCALSRVCGVCGASLGRPIAFLGTDAEVGRNNFRFPPAHLACARALANAIADAPTALLDQPEPVDRWVLLTTAAFELVRPDRTSPGRTPRFEPTGVLQVLG